MTLAQAIPGVGFQGDTSIEEGKEYIFQIHDFVQKSCDLIHAGEGMACKLPVGCSHVGSTSFTFVTGSRNFNNLGHKDTNFHTVNGARTFFVEDGEAEDEVVIGTRAAARAHNPALKNAFIKQAESGGVNEKAKPEEIFDSGKDVWVDFFEEIDEWLGKRSNSGRNCGPRDPNKSCSCMKDWSELTSLDEWSRLC